MKLVCNGCYKVGNIKKLSKWQLESVLPQRKCRIIRLLSVNDSFQARVVNSIPGLIHAHAINTKPNRIFSFFIPFPIPWGVIISKRSTEIIT